MTETLRWRPQRTRVYDPRVLENPWQRDGWRAKEDRDFFAALSGIADRQEEDEDFEVLAPIRPTRRFFQPDETVLQVSEWFNPQLADRMRSLEPEYDVGFTDTPEGRRRLVSSRSQVGRKTKHAAPFEIRLEDNFEVLDHLDRSLVRSEDECWRCYPNEWSRWPTAISSVRSVRCSDGKTRSTVLPRLVWVLEYGVISSLEVLKPQHPPHCLNPEHCVRTIRKERS